MFQAVSPPIIWSSRTVHTVQYRPSLLAATASVGQLKLQFQLTHSSGSSKQAWHIPDAVCKVLELLMMGGETA